MYINAPFFQNLHKNDSILCKSASLWYNEFNNARKKEPKRWFLMKKATIQQINKFKEQYCHSEPSREMISKDFIVNVETYEELLPGNTVKSYATGNRDIDKAFIVFKVVDSVNELLYYPVFSESLGRKLANSWGLKLPQKMTVFVTESGNGGGSGKYGSLKRKDDNKKMLQLIQYARSMMILHVPEPEPMDGAFKNIYDKLEQHPTYDVFPSYIKSVNTAISSYLKSSTNKKYENFSNLQQYIQYLQLHYPKLKLRNFDFEVLKNKMIAEYPDVNIVF